MRRMSPRKEDVKQGLWSTSVGTRGGIASVDPVFAGYVALTAKGRRGLPVHTFSALSFSTKYHLWRVCEYNHGSTRMQVST